jgi:hypothetical protein
MIKKLALFMVLFSLADIANAAVEWQVTGSQQTFYGYFASPGQTVTINLVSTDRACNGYSFGAAAEVDAWGNQIDKGGQVLSLTPGVGVTVGYPGDIDNYRGALFSNQSGYCVSYPVPANTPIFSFTYKISDSWDGTLITIEALPGGKRYTFDDGFSYVVDDSLIYLSGIANPVPFTGKLVLVPEPITLGMLGLGGLYLRKKSKKNL